MRVFVTGASGHIGSPLLAELIGAGHEVTGLARSDASAEKLARAGAAVWRGDIHDPDGFAGAVAEADGVIHLAFDHEAMISGDMEGAIATEGRVGEMFAQVLDGTGKPLVAASGTLMVAGLGRPGTEDDTATVPGRGDAENRLTGLAARGIRSSAVRLPPTVHSELDRHGFIPILIGIAREKGVSGYVGDGGNQWAAGHTLDAARVFRLALEKAPAGSRLHAAGDEGITLREIAETIGRNLGVPAGGVAATDAEAHFGFMSQLVQLDGPVTTVKTRDVLGWKPEHPGLIDDLNAGFYFKA